MVSSRPTIFVIDDDASLRRALGRVMASAGFACEVFESADQFHAGADLAKSGCIVADMTLTQKISIAEEPDENSQITTIITGKYMRTIDLTVTAIGARPAVETILEIAGAITPAA